MKNVESYERLLETLLAMKVALRDTAEPNINRELDKAIAELQHIIEANENSEASHAKALELLGKFLNNLPSIVKLIELLCG
ncbi:hypothetical protein [Hahella ganghwensis]|uniref:hypothetical protein n=1 Tax=Hahella ganghwensis TaxID=286420 RepID=UPI0003600680|nr:hypothetical protein [Hahella ganghwensis]